MASTRSAIAATGLGVLNAGWMAFDGAHALITGNYVVPSEGEYEGQLGPWATLVAWIGLDPVGAPMRWALLLIGLTWLAVSFLYFLRPSSARTRIMATYCIATLWYLPVGALLSCLILVLLHLQSWQAA